MKIHQTIYRVLDVESTGTDAQLDAICEAAYYDVDAFGKVQRGATFLLNPGKPIPCTASAIHHITDEDVASCKQWREVKAAFEAEVYVAHNAQFDRSFTGLDGLWLCTQRLAMHCWPEAPGHGNQVLRYYLGLEPVVKAAGGNHRAAFDAATTAAVLAAGLRRAVVVFPDITEVEDLIAATDKPCQVLRVPFESAGRPLFTEAETGLLEWILRKQAGGSDVIHSAQLELQRRFPRQGRIFGDEDD